MRVLGINAIFHLRYLPYLRERVFATAAGGFQVYPVEWDRLATARTVGHRPGRDARSDVCFSGPRELPLRAKS